MVAFIWSPRQLLQSDTGVPHFALDPLTYRCLLSLSPAADFAEPRPPRHNHRQLQYVQWCVAIHSAYMAHTPEQSMSDHRTSYQLQSHHVVDTSHMDTDKTMQPKQPLLIDIPAEPFPQSSPQTDCDVLQQLQDSAPKDDFLENSQGSQDNISQPPETPEPRSSDTLSLSPTSPLLSFSQKMEKLVYAGTKLSHSFAASPQI